MKISRVGPVRRTFLLFCCACAMAIGARAQGKPPGGPPPPGSPGGLGGPGGSSGGGPSGSSMSAANGKVAGTANTGNGIRSTSQFGPPGRWWDNKATVKSVGLSNDQQKRMDAIFDSHKAAIVDSYKALLTERAKLDAVTKGAQVDQARVFAQIDAVNQARSVLQKANSQMLIEIRQQMDSKQLEKLSKVTANEP